MLVVVHRIACTNNIYTMVWYSACYSISRPTMSHTSHALKTKEFIQHAMATTVGTTAKKGTNNTTSNELQLDDFNVIYSILMFCIVARDCLPKQ